MMKASTVIRFVLAAIIVTLGYLGSLANVHGFGVLFAVTGLLLAKPSEFTKPIPRKELLWLAVFFLGFIALIVGLNYLNLKLPEPQGTTRLIFATTMWVLFMAAIFYRWRKEKKTSNPKSESPN